MKACWLDGSPIYAVRGRWMHGWVKRSHGFTDAGPITPGEVEQLAAKAAEAADYRARMEAWQRTRPHDWSKLP